MRFVLTGFTHDRQFRVFAFDRIGDSEERVECTVRADLALARLYGIHLQELPLLCKGLLDQKGAEQIPALTFTEAEMRECASARAAARAADTKRKPPHRPPRENAAWRRPGFANEYGGPRGAENQRDDRVEARESGKDIYDSRGH